MTSTHDGRSSSSTRFMFPSARRDETESVTYSTSSTGLPRLRGRFEELGAVLRAPSGTDARTSSSSDAIPSGL